VKFISIRPTKGQHVQLLLVFYFLSLLLCSFLEIASREDGSADFNDLCVKRRVIVQENAFWIRALPLFHRGSYSPKTPFFWVRNRKFYSLKVEANNVKTVSKVRILPWTNIFLDLHFKSFQALEQSPMGLEGFRFGYTVRPVKLMPVEENNFPSVRTPRHCQAVEFY
jgi:hypothetical protein